MPAPDSTTTMTPSMSAMLAVLSAECGASVTDLSERAELGRSTTARVLTALEGKGLARRQRAERTGDNRVRDLWFTTALAAPELERTETPTTAGDDEPETNPAVTEPDLQESSVAPEDTAAHDVSQREEQAGTADTHTGEAADQPVPAAQDQPESDAAAENGAPIPQPMSGDQPEPESTADAEPTIEQKPDDSALGNEPAPEAPGQMAAAACVPKPDTPTASKPAGESDATQAVPPAAAPQPEAGGTVRLGKGELRALVAEHLKTHPDEEFTASQIGKALGRSSGAVANVFDALVKDGEAEMTCEKPREFRYRAKAAR